MNFNLQSELTHMNKKLNYVKAKDYVFMNSDIQGILVGQATKMIRPKRGKIYQSNSKNRSRI